MHPPSHWGGGGRGAATTFFRRLRPWGCGHRWSGPDWELEAPKGGGVCGTKTGCLCVPGGALPGVTRWCEAAHSRTVPRRLPMPVEQSFLTLFALDPRPRPSSCRAAAPAEPFDVHNVEALRRNRKKRDVGSGAEEQRSEGNQLKRGIQHLGSRGAGLTTPHPIFGEVLALRAYCARRGWDTHPNNTVGGDRIISSESISEE